MNFAVTLKTQFRKVSIFSVPSFWENVLQVRIQKCHLFAILAFCCPSQEAKVMMALR